MRSKAPLALMEQAVMVLVFALAAVLCLRVFVWSDRTSSRGYAKDQAVVEAQTAAETIKHEGEAGNGAEAALIAAAELLGGSYSREARELTVSFDSDWEGVAAGEQASYVLTAWEEEPGAEGLALVGVKVSETGGEALFELNVAWQKEAD